MDLPFNTRQTDVKLAETREREEEDVASILSEKYGIQYVDLSLQEIDSDALRIIKETDARAAEAIAFANISKVLSVAVHNPSNPALASLLEDLKIRGFTVKQFLVSSKSLEKGFSRYSALSSSAASKAGVVSVIDET